MTETNERNAAEDVPAADRETLRALVGELAEIAARPVHREKAAMWTRLNDLDSVRPMVWINEVPWHEMNVDDELTVRCGHPWARGLENRLRRTLYQWRHFPADMVVGDSLASPLAIGNTGLGLRQQGQWLNRDPKGGVSSQHFDPQITEPEDVKIIQDPVITHDEAASEANFSRMESLFGDLMPVRRQGIKHLWFTPWDNLIRLWGVEQAMMDLVLRPQMVHDIVGRFVEASLKMLDQYEALNLLDRCDDNTRVGSGGYAYTGDLPGEPFDPDHVRPANMWGCSNAQIFSEVSPEMHWEFAVKHDIPWLQRWGLNYYGCCEPLDNKMDVMARIPNLRKISMSPWIRPDRAAERVGTDYAFSFKPNPAILAEDDWRPDQARRELTEVLQATRGCHVEVILKDISTVRYQPRRLWEWSEMAMEVAEEFAK